MLSYVDCTRSLTLQILFQSKFSQIIYLLKIWNVNCFYSRQRSACDFVDFVLNIENAISVTD